MGTPEELRAHVTTCLGRALAHLTRDPEGVPDSLDAQLKLWQRVKGERGRKAVAGDLGLHEAEIALFDAALRDVERTDGAADEGAVGARNAALARLRLLGWFETIGERTRALSLEAGVEASVSEDLGRKQVRAVELVVRSLITESYGEQEALVARLREGLGERVVEKWQSTADAGDILSGCTFSELASLFVSKSEFERYESLYEDTPFLTLLKQRRRTMQSFLDDIRRIRNVLAHNKRISAIQLSLLDLYYEELMSPVQTAHDEGETQVDPADHLDASKEDMERYVAGLHEDVQEVRGDIASLRADVMASLGVIEETTARIDTRTKGIDTKLVAIGAGVLGLIVLVLVLVNLGGETKQAVDETQETAERTEAVVRDTKDAVDEGTAASRDAAEAAKEASAASKETADVTKEAAKDMAEAAKGVEEAKDEVAKGAETMKEAAESSKEAADATKEAAESSKEAAEATKDAAKKLEDTGEKIVQTLEELRSGFAALTQSGGIIANPRRPQEHYHNARMYEQRSDYAKAMQSYKAFFGFDELVFIDPHLRFQSFLKLQRGVAGAREVYYDLKKGTTNVAMELAWILLLEGEARVTAMDAYLEQHPGYAPAFYERSRDFSVARLGSQSMADKRQEKALLERFLELKEDEEFLRFYLDQTVAAAQVRDAEERLAALANISDEVLRNPVKLLYSKSGKHWSFTVQIAEMPREIFYRIGTSGEFTSTGTMPGSVNYTGHPTPKMYITDPALKTATTVQIKYRDQNGTVHGPFDSAFDPDTELVAYIRNFIMNTKATWITFLPLSGGKTGMYFSHLLPGRLAMKEIRYGVDKEVPDTLLPFSKPDPDNAFAVKPNDTIYIALDRKPAFATLQVTWQDGTKTEILRYTP